MRRPAKLSLAALLVAGCGAPPAASTVTIPPSPGSASPPASTAAPVAEASSARPRDEGAPVTSPCVLHAGGGNGRRQSFFDGGVEEHGSCWYGVECVRTPGKAGPGDGMVDVSCVDTACTCTTTSIADGTKKRDVFTTESVCMESSAARKLLVERCMKGMPAPAGANHAVD